MNNIESKEKILNSLNEISTIKLAISSAILGKGGTITGKFDSYADAISNLKGDNKLSATTVVESDVLSGKTFRNISGEILTGTIPTVTSSLISGTLTIPSRLYSSRNYIY